MAEAQSCAAAGRIADGIVTVFWMADSRFCIIVLYLSALSVLWAMRPYFPQPLPEKPAPSPESITASAPSKIALATSLASALVGLPAHHGIKHLCCSNHRLTDTVASGNQILLH